MSDWQDISTAPKVVWDEALVFDGYAVCLAYRHPDCSEHEWCRTNIGPEDEDAIINPTHWMPMPAPPTEDTP